MKKLFIILFFVSFNSLSQTKEIDELRQIWLDETWEYDVKLDDNIDWDAVFVPRIVMKNPYNPGTYLHRDWDPKSYENAVSTLLSDAGGLKVGRYYEEKVVKDATNREMSLKNTIKTYGDERYWVEIIGFSRFRILDRQNDNQLVGSIFNSIRVDSYKNYNKAYDKYIKKNKLDKRRKRGNSTVFWEDFKKRINN
jgi:hypothetical protein